MLAVTRDPKLYNKMAISSYRLRQILFRDLHESPSTHTIFLRDTVFKSLHEMTLIFNSSGEEFDDIKDFEEKTKNLQKLTLRNCYIFGEFSNLEFFPNLKELHLDGGHLDPEILGWIIKSR